jgi:hypothetical protein
MKRISIAMMLITLIGALVPTLVRAEAPMMTGKCSTRNIAMRSTVEPQMTTTVIGRVVSMEYGKQQQIAAKNMVMWLRLKTATGEEVPVYLGSSWHLTKKQLQIQVGDLLEIQGVKTPGANPQSAMTIASTVKKGDRVWKVKIPNKPTNVAKSCQPI